MILCIPIINTKRGNFQWIATSIIRASKELPIEATTMGPLRPLLSDHEPRKHDMKTAGSVRAIFTYKMYLAAFWFTFWSVLQSTQKSIINWQLALISRVDSTMKRLEMVILKFGCGTRIYMYHLKQNGPYYQLPFGKRDQACRLKLREWLKSSLKMEKKPIRFFLFLPLRVHPERYSDS